MSDEHWLTQEPAPPLEPKCAWEKFCHDLPTLWGQMAELAEEQRQIGTRMGAMSQRDETMALNIAALATRQQAVHSQIAAQGRQLGQIVEALNALGGTPSGFVGLAQDWRGSVNFTRRVVRRILVPAGAVAAAIAALWGLFHLSGSKAEEAPAPSEQQQLQEEER